MRIRRAPIVMVLVLALTPLSAAGQASDKPPSPGELRAEVARQAVRDGKIRYFPKKALEARVSGRAVIDCLIDAEGWPTDCRIAEEEPAGLDFGQTALDMSPMMKFSPGGAGSRVSVPMNFKLPK